jgi:predicted rRNA methylase YqxC with S4 and FtsJ domains
VRDEAVRRKVVEKIRLFGTSELGLEWVGVCESPLKGPAGNVEFLAYWRRKVIMEKAEDCPLT